jgi:NAD(P)H dehydrogenase (quinone)
VIVVTGATGKLGRQIVKQLLEHLPASHIGASARDPAQASDLAKRGVRVRHGDFSDPASLADAFEGATQILIVSSNASASGGDPIAQHRAAIDAARASGAKRIVYTSHMGVSASSAFPPMRDHAATEAMLRDCGTPWTALRNGFYASTVHMMIGDAATTGVLAAPKDGKVSWTAHRDLAAGAAAILVRQGQFEGPTPPLTGGEALDLNDIAAILAELHDRPVARTTIPDADFAIGLSTRGLPASVVDITMGLYRAARAGEFAAVDPTLGEMLGRPPMRLRDVLIAASDC